MNREDLLFEYFEGGLNNSQENLLFEQLQEDSSLREEFNQQMKILMLARQDAGLITAPLESAESVFSALNINSSHFYSVKRKEKFFRFVKSPKLKKAAIAALVLFLSFMGAFYTYDFGKNYLQSSKIASTETAKYPVVSSSSTDDSNTFVKNHSDGNFLFEYSQNQLNNQKILAAIFKTNSNEIDALKRYYKVKESELYAIIKKLSTNSELQSTISDSESNEFAFNYKDIYFSNSEILKTSFSDNSLLFGNNNSLGNSNFINSSKISLASAFASIIPKNSKFVISFRNNQTNNASPILNSQVVDASSNNYEVQLGYNFTDNHQVNLVLGRENFPQKFSRNIDGKQFLQIQNPSMIFIGAGYKYSFNNLFYQNTLTPYFQGLIAGTSIGPYMKLQSGLELNLIRQLSVFAGIEDGILIYNVDNNIYSTNKVNFVYGVNIKF